MHLPENSRHYSPLVRFSPLNAVPTYMKHGYAMATATEWVTAGFDLSSAEEWRWYGFGAAEANAMVQLGHDDPQDLYAGMQAGLTAEILEFWSKLDNPNGHGDIRPFLSYLSHGLAIDDAVQWVAAGLRIWQNVPVHFVAYLSSPGCIPWIEAGIRDPYEPLDWQYAGATPEIAGKFIRAGVTPEVAANWLHTKNISLDLALLWIQVGVDHPMQAWDGWRGRQRALAPKDFTSACIAAALTPTEAQRLDPNDPETWAMLECMAALRGRPTLEKQ